jgi:ribosome-associated heat shock protein Hsp15
MSDAARVRLDKWLWAARIFKTRALATVAAHGGKTHVDGSRAKPSHLVRVGETLTITRGTERLDIVVRMLSDKRGPVRGAQALYEETVESRSRRSAQSELRRSRALENPAPAKRPDKKSRRQIIRFTRGHSE